MRLNNMIMAMPLKPPPPQLGIINVYRMKIHWAVAKLPYFFYFVGDWDGPLIFARVMTSFSDEIDRLPTTFLLLNNQINKDPVCLNKFTSTWSLLWFRIVLFKKLLCCF